MTTTMKSTKKRRTASESGHGPIRPDIVQMNVDEICPAPENESLYRPVSDDDPEIMALANSIRKHGVKEPLAVSLDGYILSGHRRHAAARLAELKTVPCRTDNVRRGDPEFVEVLREYNRQRVKTLAEVTREEVVSANPEEAHRLLVEHRNAKAEVDETGTIEIEGRSHRAKISEAKRPFLDAIIKAINERRPYWPLSVRQVHYALLNDPPLIHASKPKSRYQNTHESYKAAVDLIARARLDEAIKWTCIDDETRTSETWKVFPSVAPFIRDELDGFLKGFYRDLMQSQPNHIEIVGEKNTIKGIIRPVAMEFCIPLMIGRGYSSLPPRQKMAERFRRSGKEKLILLIVSDFDPEGEDIAHSFARSMRDDFGVDNIVPKKVALTGEQVKTMKLPPKAKASEKDSSRRSRFTERNGDDVFELEAIPPAELQRILRAEIDAVIDRVAFNAEIDAEKRDAAHLDVVRRTVQKLLQEINESRNQ